ncbi:MAG: DUF2069 domain-containing protein [Arenimonas sp.]
MIGAYRAAMLCTYALVALQWLWRWTADPQPHLPWWLPPALFSLPLLPPAIAFLRVRPRAPLWAGIIALFYFCHGVAEARVDGSGWPWAEIALSLLVIFAAGWPGIMAKWRKRRLAAPPNV